MGNIIRLKDHARASAGKLTKSLADKAPPDTRIRRSTRPSEGTCSRVSMRDKDAFDVPASDASSSRLSPALSRYDRSGWLLMTLCYMERNSSVKGFVAHDATTGIIGYGILDPMAKNKQGQHYIRQWREKRQVSLRKLAARMETEPGGEPIVSYAQLSRIETGEQPFSEPILNAIADALGVTRAMLLEMDPNKQGHVLDLLNQLKPATQDQAIRMLEAFVKASAA